MKNSQSMSRFGQNGGVQNYRLSVDDLQKSNAALKDELNAETRLNNQSNVSTTHKIIKLQETGTLYAKKIEVEAKTLRDLERQIEIVQNSINEKRKDLQKVEGTDQNSLGKQIKQMERNLEKTLQKNNEILAKNRQLKEEIDSLRRERVIFDDIYSQLESELVKKKKLLQEVIKESDKAKEERGRIEEQILNLKQQASKEEVQMEKRFQNAFSFITKPTFEDSKLTEKTMMEDKSRSFRKDEKGKLDFSPVKNKALDFDIKPEISRRNSASKKRDQDIGTTLNQVEEYEKIKNMLEAKTGIKNLSEVLELYNTFEDKNTQLYNQVNVLNEERESLEKQVADVQREIDALSVNQNTEHDDPRSQMLQGIRNQILYSEHENRELQDKQRRLMETVGAFKKNIPLLFERLGCNNEHYAGMLDTAEVSDANILEYLSVIERKTNDVLQMHFFTQNRNAYSLADLKDKNNESMNSMSHIKDGPEHSTQLRDLLSAVEFETSNERDPNAPMQPNELEKFADDKIGRFVKERKKVRTKTNKVN